MNEARRPVCQARVNEKKRPVCEGDLEIAVLCEPESCEMKREVRVKAKRVSGVVEADESGLDDLSVSAVRPVVGKRQPSESDEKSRSGPKSQHEWDEAEFREAVWSKLTLSDLDDDKKKQLVELMVKHKILWTKDKLGRLDYEYDIEVPSWQSEIRVPDRRWSAKEADQIRQEIDSLLEKQFIEPARSPWAARLVLVPKPDGSTRVCVDYRKLNAATIADAYPTPRVDHVVERLSGNCYFTTLDCEKGYYQVQLSERTKDITAFLCPMGQFRWTCMPFGLRTAPAVFQRLMDLVLSGLTWEMCMVFFDDVIVFSKSWEQHLENLNKVFERMSAAGMTLNFKKCELAQKELVYLGYLVSESGVQPNPRKVKAILAMPAPTTVTQLRTVLGITNYFRKFILNYASVARPLTDLLTKGTGRKRDSTDLTAVWGDKQQEAFEKLKKALTDESMLAFPNLSKEFTLWCDASDDALGAVLIQQGDDGVSKPVEFASRVLSKREAAYSVTEREALAIVFAVRHFRHYLHGVKFRLVTDHSAVTWMLKQDDPKGRVARWVVTMQEFDYDVVHKPGTINVVADALSRLVVVPEGREGVADMTEELPNPLTDVSVKRVMPGAQKPDSANTGSKAVLERLQDRREQLELTRRPMGISNERWRTAQRADPMWRAMWEWLRYHKLSPESREWHDWVVLADKDFDIVDDILCRQIRTSVAGQNNFRLVPVVPKVFQNTVVSRAHTKDCAHAGVNRTFDWIQRRFWWPGFYTHVKQRVLECTCCQAVANPKGVSVIEGRIEPRCEFDILGMDLIQLP